MLFRILYVHIRAFQVRHGRTTEESFWFLLVTRGYMEYTHMSSMWCIKIYSMLSGSSTTRNHRLWKKHVNGFIVSYIFSLQWNISDKSIGSQLWPCHITLSMEIENPAPPALDKFRIIAFSFTLALQPGLVMATWRQSHCFSFSWREKINTF